MSEHQSYERQIGAPASTAPRGRFRPNAEGDDIALPLYREYPTAVWVERNRINPRTGKPLPRVNEAKRALRAVAA